MGWKRKNLAVLAALCLLGAACGSSGGGKTSSPTTSGGGTPTTGASAPTTTAAGTPVKGGVLNMLGTGDVDYMDPNVSYYTTGYLALRLWSRQLLTYPATPGHTTDLVADLATAIPTTANGGISADGLTYKLTIRTGAMWDTTPPRQVTAADEVLGLKRTCNPSEPFGGLPDFETLIVGFQAFCTAFEKVTPSVAAIAAFVAANNIPGVSVDPSNPQTVDFKLVHPATYFVDQLAIPAFSPAPKEVLQYLPASAALAQHTIADGPYEIKSYIPARSIVFVRNPAWNASTDMVRKAYVNEVDVSETGDQQSIQQQLETGSAAADMGWDAQVPTADIPALLAAHDSKLALSPTFGTSPYLVFDEVSPNNGSAMANKTVRQALEYGIDRTNLIQDYGGPQVSPPLTHILPPGTDGSQQINPYPYDPTKAKAMIASAVPGGHLKLKVLYQSAFDYQVKMFETLQSDLAKVGITVTGVGVPSADFYTKYLEVPSVAKSGVWDMALTSWFPDWYGDSALSFFSPLFGGSAAFPPSGSNFGFYQDSAVDTMIQQASTAISASAAAVTWAKADAQVMADAAVFPITSPNAANYAAAQVHNAIYIPNLFQFDPANVWLSPSQNGG